MRPTLPKPPLAASFPRAGNHGPLGSRHTTFHDAAVRPARRDRDLRRTGAAPVTDPRQRAAALEKAAEIRKARAQLKEQLKQGKTTLGAVLERAENDDVVGKLKVSAVLQAMPGIGKIRATQIMEKLKIADSRRLRGLGEQQRKALLGEFAAN